MAEYFCFRRFKRSCSRKLQHLFIFTKVLKVYSKLALSLGIVRKKILHYEQVPVNLDSLYSLRWMLSFLLKQSSNSSSACSHVLQRYLY